MKAMIKSALTVILAFMLFSSAVYAWFTNTNRSVVQPVSVSVTDGALYSYEINYYTKDHVYKYDTTSNAMLVYDESSSSWILPSQLPYNSGFMYEGVIVGKYDVLIPENNEKNNLIIEINFEFTNQSAMQISHQMISNPSLSSGVVQSLILDTSRPYYMSEVAHVQTLISDAYNGYAESFNKYEVLTTEFNTKDQANNDVYEKFSFYQNSIYSPSLNLGTQTIESQSMVRYYYNISYDEARLSQFFSQEFEIANYEITNLPSILFFKDIYIAYRGGFN